MLLVPQEKTGLARCRCIQDPPTSAPHTGTGPLWGDPATAGTGRFFQTLGRAPAADVTQSAATGTQGCSLAGVKALAVMY